MCSWGLVRSWTQHREILAMPSQARAGLFLPSWNVARRQLALREPLNSWSPSLYLVQLLG